MRKQIIMQRGRYFAQCSARDACCCHTEWLDKHMQRDTNRCGWVGKRHLDRASLAAGASCTISLNVQAAAVGAAN
jgi:hypothetical protein